MRIIKKINAKSIALKTTHVFIVVIILFGALVGCSESTTIEPIHQSPQLPPEIGTVQRLNYELVKSFDNKGFKIVRTDHRLVVNYNVGDSFSKKMILSGMNIDAYEAVKAVEGSGFQYVTFVLQGYFPVIDNYGNETKDMILQAEYLKSTIDNLNWNNVLFSKFLSVSDKVWIRPGFNY